MYTNSYLVLGAALLLGAATLVSFKKPLWGPLLELCMGDSLPFFGLIIPLIMWLIWPLSLLFLIFYAFCSLPGMEVEEEAKRLQNIRTQDQAPESIPGPGTRGISLCNLSPSGRVEMNGQEYEALSNGMFIEEGRPVECIGHSLGRMKVAELEDL